MFNPLKVGNIKRNTSVFHADDSHQYCTEPVYTTANQYNISGCQERYNRMEDTGRIMRHIYNILLKVAKQYTSDAYP